MLGMCIGDKNAIGGVKNVKIALKANRSLKYGQVKRSHVSVEKTGSYLPRSLLDQDNVIYPPSPTSPHHNSYRWRVYRVRINFTVAYTA